MARPLEPAHKLRRRVYNYLLGYALDDPTKLPVHYSLTQQGNAMILRDSRFNNQTVAPPPGFDVYKCVIWFNTHWQTFYSAPTHTRTRASFPTIL